MPMLSCSNAYATPGFLITYHYLLDQNDGTGTLAPRRDPDLVQQHWQGPGATTVAGLWAKISALTKGLTRWEKSTFGNVKAEIKRLNVELGRLQADPSRTEPTRIEVKIKDRLVELYHREEVMWRQRARITWLAAGDKSTKFFHLHASRLRLKNKIKALMKEDGTTTDDADEMGNLVTALYRDLFTSEGTSNMERVIDTVPCKVTEEMNKN
ncbi:hypothetical protein VPH35_059623 [Triticum aestivum]